MTLNFFRDIIFLLIFSFLWLICLIGWGGIVKYLIGIRSPSKAFFSDAWIGMVGIVALLETVGIWVPIDWKVAFITMLVGILGLFSFYYRKIRHQFFYFKNYWDLNPFIFIIGFIILTIGGSFAMMAPINYDSGLYHFQSIRWLNEYPLVIGLTNLHSRLGFNQSYFNFLALLNFYPFFNKGYVIPPSK